MNRRGKRAMYGFAAFLMAVLGLAVLFAGPATADPQDCDRTTNQGLFTSNLGV